MTQAIISAESDDLVTGHQIPLVAGAAGKA